jgi:hypothetical protein
LLFVLVSQLETFKKELEESIKFKMEETQTFERSNSDLIQKVEESQVRHAEELSALRRRHQSELDDLQSSLDSVSDPSFLSIIFHQ